MQEWLWDSWFVRTGDGLTHQFQLSAPKSVKAEERHHQSRVRHFISNDLVAWQDRGVVLEPSLGWDDLAIWTGSVILRDGRYLMYYTGRSKQDFWVQKIGLAIAVDETLDHWEKFSDNFVLEADDSIYEMPNQLNELNSPPLFRDPFAFIDPKTGRNYIAFSGSMKGAGTYGACIGLADSADPFHPVLLSPLCAPGRYAEMECPQIVFANGKVYLFFSVLKTKYDPAWLEKNPVAQGGLHCYVAESLANIFTPLGRSGIVLDNGLSEYGHGLVAQEGNNITLIGFKNFDSSGNFVGGTAPPISLRIDEEIHIRKT